MDALVGVNLPDTEKVKHHAACHCGKIRFEFLMRPLKRQRVIVDNCSICQQNGYVFAYIEPSRVTWVSGENELQEYRFHTGTKTHKFCPTCGSSVLMDLGTTIAKHLLAINVRMIKDVELDDLNYIRTNSRTQ